MVEITSCHSEGNFIVLENSANTLRLSRQEAIAFLDQLDAACLSGESGSIIIADFEMTRSEAEQLRNDLRTRLEQQDDDDVNDDWASEGF